MSDYPPKAAVAEAPIQAPKEIPIWQACRAIAEVYKVSATEVLASTLALFAGMAGSRLVIAGDPPSPLPFSLLLVPDCDREPIWWPELIEPVTTFQKDYATQIGPGLRARQDPIAARKDLLAAQHLRQFGDMFAEEVRSLEESAILRKRPVRWLFAHNVRTAGALVPTTGVGHHLLALMAGKKDLRLLNRQAGNPRSILRHAQPDAKSPRVHLLGWIDQATVRRVMDMEDSALAKTAPLLLPVSPGQTPQHGHIGLNMLFRHGLGGLMEKRWIEAPWRFAPTDELRAKINVVEDSFQATLEKAPANAKPWLAALPALPMRLVATAHLLGDIFGDHSCHLGREDLVTDTLQLANILRTRLLRWLPAVLPGVSAAQLTALDLKILDRIQRQAPITVREIQRRVHRLQASDRDESLARLESAGMITRHGQLILPKE